MFMNGRYLGFWLVLIGLLIPVLGTGQTESLDELYKKALKEGGTVNFYGTHDQIEALSMSNAIAVMSSGVIVQEGGPRDIYMHPKTQFFA
jgi:ABC-type Fe3+/spermidine/putrescine transport system ATPase subunit